MTPLAVAAPAGAPSHDGAPVSIAPLRVVLDTNVLLSLFVFADSRFAIFRNRIAAGRWIAFANEATLSEFRRVLGYPMFRLDAAAQDRSYADWLAMLARPGAPPAYRVPLPPCRDKDDQKFLELARDARADWLVTSDKALLALARRGKLARVFRILTPEAALSATGPTPSPDV